MFDCLWPPIHGQFWLGRKIRFYISESANRLCNFIVPNDEQTAITNCEWPLRGGQKRLEQGQQPRNAALLRAVRQHVDAPLCAQSGASVRLGVGQPIFSSTSWIGSSNTILRISE